MDAATLDRPAFGGLLRAWRARRRISQLELASRAEVSTRHVSFLETGRARPSREMVLHLAESLEVPLRERNALLAAAGFAAAYAERPLDHPELAPAREALELVLAGHEPYPAVVVDRWWDLVGANSAIAVFTEGAPAELLEPPVNVVRFSTHPDGLARRILNFDEYAAHLVGRLRRQVELTADPRLAALLAEVRDYPGVVEVPGLEPRGSALVPLRIRSADGVAVLSFFSTIATFGTPVDVTLEELAIEAFFPADDASRAAFAR
jgi:transcriptional regulator with XRE-family HTH domain